MKARRFTNPRGWLRPGGAILIAVLVAGCAAGEASDSGSASASAVASAATGAVGTVSPAPTTPADMLAAALAPLQDAAEFQTTVTIDGDVAVTSQGRSVGGATQLTVTTAGTAVEYIQIPPQAWARQSGGSWVLIAVNEAPGNPLSVLAAPTTLDGPVSLLTDTFRATYPAAALGLEGDPVTLEITLDGSSVTFTYQTDMTGHPAVSQTRIAPTTQLDPIVAPVT